MTGRGDGRLSSLDRAVQLLALGVVMWVWPVPHRLSAVEGQRGTASRWTPFMLLSGDPFRFHLLLKMSRGKATIVSDVCPSGRTRASVAHVGRCCSSISQTMAR